MEAGELLQHLQIFSCLLGLGNGSEPLDAPCSNIQSFAFLRQHQQESHSQTVNSLAAELRDMRLELRKREKERRESERVWLNSREDWKTEEEKLMHNLQRRDRLIQVD